MNKKQLLFGMFAALALTGCSSDDVAESSDSSLISDGTPRYLAVNIVPNSSTATKAEYTDGVTEGEANESKVNNVRFYFFTDDGHAAAVKADGTNFYDWTPTSESTNSSENITKSLAATIVIDTKAGDRIPSKILAVVNPRSTELPNGNADLATLRNTYKDYATLANATSPLFVMTNAVYRDRNNERVSTSSIASTNLKTTESDALKAPVSIYVERNVGKVSVSYSDELAKNVTDNTIAITDKQDKVITVTDDDGDSKQVYLKILGWDLTATTSYSYVSKHINTSWKNDLLSSDEPWTSDDYKRSFWASNIHNAGGGTSGEEISGINYSSFNQHIAAANVKEVAATSTLTPKNYKYTNENAAYDYGTGEQRLYPTQAIVLGQLVDEKGNALYISEYAGSRHLEADASFTQFRTLIANLLSSQYYNKVNDTTYVAMTPSDLTVTTCSADASEGDLNAQATSGRYKVKVQLSEAGLAKTWSVGSSKDAATITAANLNTALGAYTGKAWNNGYTYYSFKINHLATKDVGMYGIVRNHYYSAVINGIYGLGTPVYDPDKKIYPEEPIDEDTYIAAQIHVLSWRVVPSTVTLGKDTNTKTVGE